MGLFDRISTVVKAEWNARFGEHDHALKGESERAARRREAAERPPRSAKRAVTDVESAYRVLEVSPHATLDEVREAYRQLARRYHPRTFSPVPDQAHAAQTVLDALTDALELLEVHLLPLPEDRRA